MTDQQEKSIALLGAGSWGTALALYLARRHQVVRMYSVEAKEIEAMLADQENRRFMPGHKLPSTIQPTVDLELAVKDVDDIIIVVPSVGFRDVLDALKKYIHPRTRIVCATKGLDTNTGDLLSDICQQVLGDTHPFAVLSGPSFAREVAAGLPAAVVIASKNKLLREALFKRFDSDIFRIDLSDDVIGVEIGGVVKNVIAIATGIVDGLALGANARSAIITRGLAEIIRLGEALGGQLKTFIGLAGLGDLILTCSDDQSRNRRLGLAIGRGKTVSEAEREIGQVVEGKRNAELVAILAKKHHIQMPIVETVWAILQDQAEPKKAIIQLLAG